MAVSLFSVPWHMPVLYNPNVACLFSRKTCASMLNLNVKGHINTVGGGGYMSHVHFLNANVAWLSPIFFRCRIVMSNLGNGHVVISGVYSHTCVLARWF